jgi:hypothetical protein
MFKHTRALVLAALLAATLAASGCAARGATTGAQPTNQPTDQAATSERSAADATLRARLALERLAILNGAPLHQHTTTNGGDLAAQLARARLATARYATNLHTAKADGYQIITRMIPDMGWHFLNPNIQGFDVTKPPILVYERRGRAWQLGALEWVFPSKPAAPPLPGATYGSFGAACHYKDGTFVPAPMQDACPKRSPQTGARFNFWHPDLVTLHVWLWYPNPAGLYSGTNPYVTPFNHS